jgi:PAS domain S-box-containing protein
LFTQGGELAAFMTAHDWSTSPLGHPSGWSESLRTTVGLLLRAQAQIVLFWGPEFIAIYNDAYVPTIGAKHPTALGRPARENWAEMWDDLCPLLDGVLRTQQTFSARDRPFYIERHGYGETAYFDISYSAVLEADGTVGGVLCIVSETTERVRAEQALRASESRFRNLITASSTSVYRMSADWREMRHLQGQGFLTDCPAPRTDWLEHYIPASEHPDVLAAVAEAIRTRSMFELEHRVLRANGAQAWTHSRAVPVFDETGTLIEWFGAASDVTARRTAVERLRESDQQWQTLGETLPAFLFITDADGQNIYTNREFQTYAGLPAEALLGDGWLRTVDPADRDRVAAAWNASWRNHHPYNIEYRFVRADGASRWYSVRGNPVMDSGQVVRWVGVASDIHDRRQGEENLARSEARFRGVFESGAVGFAIFNANTRETLAVNDRLLAITGHTRQDFDQKRWGWRRQTAPEHLPRYEAAMTEARESGFWKPFETEFLHTAGRRVPVRLSAAPLPGEPGWVVAVVDDLTETRAAEAALRLREEQLRLATDAAEIGFWDVDMVNETMFWPPRVKAMFGISPDVPVTLADFYAGVHPNDFAATAEAYAAASDPNRRALYDVEYRTVGKEDGVIRWVAAKGRGIFDETGKCLRTIGVAIDITRRKAAEARLAESEARLRELNETLERRVEERTRQLEHAHEALRQAQKMEAIGQLTGGIAHDFNNLLQSIAGSLELIRRRPAEPDRVARLADAGLKAAERGAKLTGQLLAFSRMQKLEMRPVDLAEVTSNLRDMLDRSLGASVRVTIDLASDDLAVLGDDVQLELALLNLCLNARDAMPEGGDLTIHARAEKVLGDPELPDGDYVLLAVSDTGAGMPPDVAARAFDPFFTTKGVGKGTGLGLSQVYGTVRQAGGAVRIETTQGAGTTIRMYLQATAARPKTHQHAGRADIPAEAAARVMVVDDDPDVRAFMQESLQSLGYQPLIFSDGATALQELDGQKPDAVILDFAMPGMNGAEVAREIGRLQPRLPIVFASGFAETAAIEAVAGNTATLLRKPFQLADLQTLLAAVLSD